jgi:hypothetical protein
MDMDTWILNTMDFGLWIKLYWIGSYWTLAWTNTGLDYLDLGQDYSGLPWITLFPAFSLLAALSGVRQ